MPATSDSSGPAQTLVVADDAVGTRLDVFLAQRFPNHSRVNLRRAITGGGVTVDGGGVKPSMKLRAGQQVTITLPSLPRESPSPEPMPLDILFEDEWLVAINKPPGVVVHPGKGNWSGTLTNALAFHFTQLSTVGGAARPGIVHRLDRDTSGVLVVAKTDQAHLRLAAQFEARTTEKEYFAIVASVPDRDRDRIVQPIGMHPYQREKMAIRRDHSTSRDAETFYEVLCRYSRFATLRVTPKTGRTHQIRVHLAHAGCPVLCDRMYGGRSQITRGMLLGVPDEQVVLERQALHARRLCVTHPESGARLEIVAPIPPDLAAVVGILDSDERRDERRATSD